MYCICIVNRTIVFEFATISHTKMIPLIVSLFHLVDALMCYIVLLVHSIYVSNLHCHSAVAATSSDYSVMIIWNVTVQQHYYAK